ncbi:Uncharacterized protein FKW44_023409 [Caligus rogercresseyi]|uniref:Uncharacterized protein n=1 Tax=Caligus rogercresseyi TaxID=217165 RepID=A0A7T8JVC5_CALRO|nr:Uncharacterized protein FKW44_023409 [Caligus rogercresseyi]
MILIPRLSGAPMRGLHVSINQFVKQFTPNGSPHTGDRVTEEIFNESPRDRSPENEEEESVGGSNPLMIEKLSQTLDGARTPLHFLIYGRLSHRIDSYSIVDAAQRVSTHVYLTDSGVEAETLLTQRTINGASAPPPDGLLSLLTPTLSPRRDGGKEAEGAPTGLQDPWENESLSSSFKLYAAKHIRDANNSGINRIPHTDCDEQNISTSNESS